MRRLLTITLASALVLATSAECFARMRCSVTATVGPNFGSYDTFSPSANDSAGYVGFRCTGVEATDMVRVQLGRGRGNRPLERHMKWRGNRMEYNLYIDAARTVIWRDGSRGTGRHDIRPPEDVEVTLPVYGRIPPRQAAPPGQYEDTVQVVILY